MNDEFSLDGVDNAACLAVDLLDNDHQPNGAGKGKVGGSDGKIGAAKIIQ